MHRHRLAVTEQYWWNNFGEQQKTGEEDWCWPHRGWSSLCWLYDPTHLSHTVYVRGKEKQLTKSKKQDLVDVDLANFNKDLQFMGPGLSPSLRNTSLKGAAVALFGKMSDINIWDRLLTRREVQDWSACHPNPSLNDSLVNWSRASYLVTPGVEEVEVERAVLCQPVLAVPGLQVFPRRRDFSSQVEFCKVLGGAMAVADTTANMDLMLQVMKGSIRDKLDRSFFTGFTDIEQEGRFVNVNTGADINPNNWAEEQPVDEDCTAALAFVQNFGLQHAASCSEQFHTICNLTSVPKLELRGSCRQGDGRQVLDTHYHMARAANTSQDRQFVGVSGLPGVQTSLARDSQGGWAFTSLWTGAVVARTQARDYPLGTHTWTFQTGHCGDNSTVLRMNLHR